MCLANIAVLLSQWGHKVLIVDWDLEAPGLENFYKDGREINVAEKNGLINILTDLRESTQTDLNSKTAYSTPLADWKSCVNKIFIEGTKQSLDLITSGKRDDKYYEKVRSFDVNLFYKENAGGEYIEQLRNSWKADYDFILIDSRTGITDIGGICTIQLPDILILLFTATDQGFTGICNVAQRAIKSRQQLPLERLNLLTLPIPTRIDNSEKNQTDNWFKKFERGLESIYSTWLPRSVDRESFLKLTKVPYISFYSYGEKLPVLEQSNIVDTTGIGYAYQSIASLLATKLNNPELLTENRDKLLKLSDLFFLKQVTDEIGTTIKNELDSLHLVVFFDKTINDYTEYLNDLISKDQGSEGMSSLAKEFGSIFNEYISNAIKNFNWKDEISKAIFEKLRSIDYHIIEAVNDSLESVITNQFSFISSRFQDSIFKTLQNKGVTNYSGFTDNIVKQGKWIEFDLGKQIKDKLNYLLEDQIDKERKDKRVYGDKKESFQYLKEPSQQGQVQYADSSNGMVKRSVLGDGITTAFIIRPFGRKQGIDFDMVEEKLIYPALKAIGIGSCTTGEIIEAGNLLVDVFSELLIADLVIADTSVHNANVFYELGIRHSLRDKKAFFIRSKYSEEILFDLKTYRTLGYDADDPASTTKDLIIGLLNTVKSDQQDSPVFLMLPQLETSDHEKFLAIPADFSEEVEMARGTGSTGKLALLSAETDGFPWQVPALRLIGRWQFQLKALEDARLTWEKIRNRNANDIEANDRLASIYQRLAEAVIDDNPEYGLELFNRSTLAIERLLKNIFKADRSKQAEIIALNARNLKAKWIDSWKKCPETERARNALQSNFLKEAYEEYEHAYFQDLNHFYAGINALSMLTIFIDLAERLHDLFELNYDNEDEGRIALKKLKQQHQKLATVVGLSLDSEKKRLESQGGADFWLMFTEADFSCITQTVPDRVGNLYRRAIEAAGRMNVESVRRQLLIYEQLDVLSKNVHAALAAFMNTGTNIETKPKHYVVFTGHMIDKPDRKEPRFPPSMEAIAYNAIKDAIKREKSKVDGEIIGIAGGACGGDILFHEACAELAIPTELYLALPRELLLGASVQFAGPSWVERFNNLYKKLPVFQLTESEKLPGWLQKKEGYNIWERSNLWMLNSALVNGGLYTTMIALWDGKGGDSAGGTEHMVQQAQKSGAKTVVIDTGKLFDFKHSKK